MEVEEANLKVEEAGPSAIGSVPFEGYGFKGKGCECNGCEGNDRECNGCEVGVVNRRMQAILSLAASII
jgi:hypothetical protein